MANVDATETVPTAPPYPALPPPPSPNPWRQWTPPGPTPSGPPLRPRARRTPHEPDPAPRRLLALAVVAGLALEVGLRGGPANGVVAFGVGALVVALVTDGRLHQRSARLVAATALLPAAFLAVRTSPWLTGANLLAIASLVGVALACSRSGSPFDTTLGRLTFRLLHAVPAAVTGPEALAPLVPRVDPGRRARLQRVLVACLICVPVLLVVVLLLASADAVFAGLLQPDLHLGPVLGHLVWAVLLTTLVLGVVGAAAARTADPKPVGRFGVLETVTMLGLTAAVLALFVVAQLVALTGAGDRLVEQAGLTPAEYARSGFFQLCWATGLILTLLAGIRWLAAPDALRAPAVRVLAAAVPLLTLGLVAVSLRRLALYDAAFGLTMLRLWVVGAAVWMGVVLLCLAARNAGVAAGRAWVLGASGVAALVLVLVADVANPEAFIVRHNLARAEQGSELDPAYLATLSDDAAPALADAVRGADPGTRATLAPALRCDEAPPTGARSVNAAVRRASPSRQAACEALAQE